MEKAVVASSVAIPLSKLTPDEVKTIKKKLTLKKRQSASVIFGKEPENPFVFFFRIEQDHMIVPRRFGIEYCHENRIEIEDRRSDGDKIQIVFNEEKQKEKPDLKPTQDSIVNDVTSCIESTPIHSGILKSSTGTGKTVMGTKLIAVTERRALVVVHTEFLLGQWKKALLEFTDIKEDEIGTIQQKERDTSGKKVVIGMIHTIIKRDFTPEERKAFGLIVFDECQHLPAEEFSNALMKFDAKRIVGLSATPKRFDGLDKLLKLGIGDVLNKENIAVQLVPDVYVREHLTSIPGHRYLRNVVIKGKEVKAANLAQLTNELIKITTRNQLIVSYVAQATKKERKLMVFSGRIRHLKALMAGLEAIVGPDKAAMFVGGMKKKEREAAEGKQVLFCTYQYASEALDIPDRDCLIMATPVTFVSQVLGRILRSDDGKKTPIVVDIRDTGVKKLEMMSTNRAKEYKKMRANIHLPNGSVIN